MKATLITIATTLLLGAASVHAAPCAGFVDVEDTSPFCPNVAWMKQNGITLGCAAPGGRTDQLCEASSGPSSSCDQPRNA